MWAEISAAYYPNMHWMNNIKDTPFVYNYAIVLTYYEWELFFPEKTQRIEALKDKREMNFETIKLWISI